MRLRLRIPQIREPSHRLRHVIVLAVVLALLGAPLVATVEPPGRAQPIRIRAGDSWQPVAAAPLVGRSQHTAVWTGTVMIVWGGQSTALGNVLGDGAIYNPATNVWSAMSSKDAPSARRLHSAVWTGTEMIVWGGRDGAFTPLGTGARYNPALNTWTPLSTSVGVPSARDSHPAVWTGTEMGIWGGFANNAFVGTGSFYGTGGDPSFPWTPVTSAGAPAGRSSHTAVWSGTEMIVWGGNIPAPQNGGGRYDPVGYTWADLSTVGAPVARFSHSAVWAGTEMIVWGGNGANGPVNDGGRYRPSTNSWAGVAAGPLSARLGHTAVWTGTEMLVWGGGADGARYNPAGDTWVALPSAEAPSNRSGHTAIWTGSPLNQMIVWGGRSGNTLLADGARYGAPSLDLVVNSSGDGADANPADGVCQTATVGECTLRAAIEQRNVGGVPETIKFAIPANQCVGQQLICRIEPATLLPAVQRAGTIIDGYTQSGASPNTQAVTFGGPADAQLRIHLRPPQTGTTVGSALRVAAANVSIRGLAVTNFPGDGIELLSTGAVVEGNFVGLAPNGAAAGNAGNGIRVSGDNNRIGDITSAANNVIAANLENGVRLAGNGNTVQGNRVGLPGQATFGNVIDGVRVAAGSDHAILRNYLALNGSDGVAILGGVGTRVQGNVIQGRHLSNLPPGTSNGVGVYNGATNVRIGGTGVDANQIVQHSGAGVLVDGAGTQAQIHINSIFGNGRLGIDLGGDGITPNDESDNDTGPNGLQNYPVLNSALPDGADILVDGFLRSTPNTDFLLHFYSTDPCHSSGYGEGFTYRGELTVRTNGIGITSVGKRLTGVAVGLGITSTATNLTTNMTSEFSECRVGAPPAPSATPLPPTTVPTPIPSPAATTVPTIVPTTVPTIVPPTATLPPGILRAQAYTGVAVNLPVPEPGSDLSVFGFEVTQGIQCFDTSQGLPTCPDNSLPMVAGKATTIRIYLKYTSPSGGVLRNVPARLFYCLGTGPCTNPQVVNVTGTAKPTLSQANSDDSADVFFQTDEATQTVQFYVEVDPDHVVVEALENNNRFPFSGTTAITFNRRATRSIVGVPVNYTAPGYTGPNRPSGVALTGEGAAWLERVYPVQQGGIPYQLLGTAVNLSNPLVVTDASTDGGAELIRKLNEFYNDRVSLNAALGVANPDQMYGWEPSAAYNGGLADAPYWKATGGLGRVAWGTDAGALGTVDTPGSGVMVFAHEITHLFDVWHTGTADGCGARVPPGDFPYASSSIQEFGFNPITRQIYNPATTWDLMSYCAVRGSRSGWISPFTWNKLFNLLGTTAAGVGRSNGVLELRGPVTTGAAESLTVTASILRAGGGGLGRLARMPGGVASALPAGDYAVELRNGAVVLRRESFAVGFLSHGVPDVGEILSDGMNVALIMPWEPGTTQVVLLQGDQVLDQRLVSTNPPVVQITSPTTAVSWPAGSTQTLTWQGTDADSPALTYAVAYSADGGSSWQPLVSELTASSYQVRVDDLAGAVNARFQIIANDGVNSGSAQTTAPIQIPNKAPLARITNVQSPVFIRPGDLLLLQGQALDLENGTLPGSGLGWSSNLQGVLGSGATLAIDTLAVGTHQVTLTATDSSGATGTAVISVTVTGNPPTLTPTPTPTGGTPTPNVTPTATPTARVGGRSLTLEGGAGDPVRLSWRTGVDQTGYLVIRWDAVGNQFAFLPRFDQLLPGGVTQYLDNGPLPGATYCYVLLIVQGNPPSINQVIGLSDLICVYPHHDSGTPPPGFALRLNDGTRAQLTWGAPGGQDRYELTAVRFDGTAPRTFALGGQVTSFTDETATVALPGGASTCYQLRALNGPTQEIGRTDTVCGAPGVSAIPAGGNVADVLDRLTSRLRGTSPR